MNRKNRGELPVAKQPVGPCIRKVRRFENKRQVEGAAEVEAAIPPLAVSVVRILRLRTAQITLGIRLTNAVSPRVIRQNRVVIAEAMLRLQQESLILGIGPIIRLINVRN